MSTAEIRAVLSRFLPADASNRVEPLLNAGGWSGSQIWRLTVRGESANAWAYGRVLCLRRWPESTARERLLLIHYVLTQVAARGIDFVPVPIAAPATCDTFVEHAGHFWELTPWLPGAADYRVRPTRQRLAAAMMALGRFHEAAAGLGDKGRGTEDGGTPAIVERLELVERLLAGDLSRIVHACKQGLSETLDTRAERVLASAPSKLPPLVDPLRAAARVALPLSPAIRDVHHQHVLFTGDRVTGLIDFGALRIDTPLADVARLLGSLAGDDQAARQFALGAYGSRRPLSRQDRELTDLLDRANVALSGLNWLRWLYVERRDMGPLPPIVRQLDEIVARLAAPT
jgi:Ser/Thr protein kinase RdoA (MazF antagonist)